jgi:hypothetical protein
MSTTGPHPRPTRRALLIGAFASGAAACDFRRHYPDAGFAADSRAGVDESVPDSDRVDASADVTVSPAVDIDSMNALLTVEYRLVAMYDSIVPLLRTPAASDPREADGPAWADVATHWRDEHLRAATAIADVISRAGGEPVVRADVTYAVPPGFTSEVAHAVELLSNEEKNAAMAFVHRVAQLAIATNRQLASAVAGAHTQRFAVSYAVARGAIRPASAFASMSNSIVPTAFTFHVGMEPGLDSVADLAPA